jgi:hypothetical protein
MSLYDKSSIALIPSGTKASKLYSVLPANGDGDFTHSRSNTTATRVNKDGLIENVGSNIPRLDYPLTNGVAGDCPHLLLEPQRLNYSNYTEALSNWVDENVTTTDNQTVSPDGSVNASKIVENSSNTFHFISKLTSSTTTANNLVFTCFLKKGTRTNAYVYFRTYSNANRYGISVNLENGTITDTETSGSPTNVETSVTAYGNDWYRVKVRMYQVSGTATMLIGPNNNTTINGINNTYQGDGSSYIYAWGTQLEVGDFETSYIPSPNTATQVTRSADVCNGSGTSAEFNDSEGVLFAEIAVLEGDTSVVQLSISNGTDNENIKLLQLNSTTVRAEVKMSAGTNFVEDITIDAENSNKFAIQYKANDYKVFVNGTKQSVTQRSTTPTGLDTLNFDRGDGASDFYGKVKQVIIFNEALSDSELATLTS